MYVTITMCFINIMCSRSRFSILYNHNVFTDSHNVFTDNHNVFIDNHNVFIDNHNVFTDDHMCSLITIMYSFI